MCVAVLMEMSTKCDDIYTIHSYSPGKIHHGRGIKLPSRRNNLVSCFSASLCHCLLLRWHNGLRDRIAMAAEMEATHEPNYMDYH